MVHLDYRDARPIYIQIVDGFRKQILAGALQPGEKLPSVRELAGELSINPNTIQRAYREMEAAGYIQTIPGKGCFVAEDAKQLLGSYKRKQLEQLEQKVHEWKLAGIPLQEIEQCIRQAYQKEGTS